MSQGAAQQRLKRVRDEAAAQERRAAVQRRDAAAANTAALKPHTRRDGSDEEEKKDSAVPDSAVRSTSMSVNAASLASETAAAAMTCDALLVIGTYHSVMAGLVLRRGKFFIKFSVKHHVGCVNAVAVTPRYIASCGIDERVFLFTNKSATHHTMLSKQQKGAMADTHASSPFTHCATHTGGNSSNGSSATESHTTALRLADLGSLTPPTEVTCLAFTPHTAGRQAGNAGQHLFCGCADGQLLVYRTRDWALVGQLTVHEKAMRGIAVHPTSAGALVVSIGADRSVAVLDMVRQRLLTKWKYSSTATRAAAAATTREEGAAQRKATHGDATQEAKDTSETQTGVDAAAARNKKTTTGKKKKKQMMSETEDAVPLPPSPLLPTREEPIGLLFSPSGSYLVVYARFSFVVYAVQTLRPLCVFRYAAPQPEDELHSCVFVSERVMLLGNEAGTLLACTLPPSSSSCGKQGKLEEGRVDSNDDEGAQYVVKMAGKEEEEGDEDESGDAVVLRPVELRYPAALAAEANALCGRPVQVERETRQKHPLRHTARIKALCVHGQTLYSMDSNGVLLACLVHPPCRAATHMQEGDEAAGPSATSSSRCVLEYVTSVNCQARVTSMDCLAL